MRIFFPMVLLMPGLSWADTFQLPAPVSAATVYPSGAEVVRSASQQMSTGRHRVELLLPLADALPDLAVGGEVRVLGMQVDAYDQSVEPFYSPAQKTAWAAVEVAEQRLWAAQDGRQGVVDQIAVLDDQLSYLRGISAGAGDQPDAETLQSTLALLGAQLGTLRAQKVTLTRSLEETAALVAEAERDLRLARAALGASGAPDEDWALVSFDVLATAETTFAIEVETFTSNARWEPFYTLSLDTQTGTLGIERDAHLHTSDEIAWHDVQLTLSTLTPGDRLDPSPIYENIARYFDRPELRSLSSGKAVAMEAPIVVEAFDQASIGQGRGGYDGAAFVYTFDEPQSLSADAFRALSLGRDQLDGQVQTVAIPRQDQSAFVTVDLTNATGGPLLAGRTRLLRDGTFVGEGTMQETADGADLTLAFGAQETLRLTHRVAERETGDRGLLARSNTRQEVIELEVRNLDDAVAEVRVMYALPVSEQEDLQIDIHATPQISERDVDGKRGVAAWDLVLDPGEVRVITLDMSLSWPEGQDLNWWP